ncbi:MAG TPA: LysR family transcriptional regulator, partial [Planctomycetota bacterium]|nr:LysR family transcriptional regulator [Planctomycetota bacterium]
MYNCTDESDTGDKHFVFNFPAWLQAVPALLCLLEVNYPAMSERQYFKELRLQQFRALIGLGRHGTFTAAAEALGLSRTSVWQQIRSLENQFNSELVVLHGNQHVLTPEGRVLIELITPVVEGFDDVKNEFHERLGKLKRRLVVATTASLLMNELRDPIAQFRKQHPEVSISLVDRFSSAALTLLLRGEADVAVVGRPSQMPEDKVLKLKPLSAYPFVVICPR